MVTESFESCVACHVQWALCDDLNNIPLPRDPGV